MKWISIEEKITNSRNQTLFFGYFRRPNFYVLRIKHDVITKTEHPTFSLTLVYYLSRQADPTVCVSNHKNVCSVKRSHFLRITFLNFHSMDIV